MIVRVPSADQAFRERVNAFRVVQTGRVVRRMRIEIEVAAQTDVVDPCDFHRVIEVIEHVPDAH